MNKIREQEENFHKRKIHLTTNYGILKQSLGENLSHLIERVVLLEEDRKRKEA